MKTGDIVEISHPDYNGVIGMILTPSRRYRNLVNGWKVVVIGNTDLILNIEERHMTLFDDKSLCETCDGSGVIDSRDPQ